MLIMEDSDHYHLFTAEERREFIFQLLLHLSLGGPVNQVGDTIASSPQNHWSLLTALYSMKMTLALTLQQSKYSIKN